MRGVLREVLEAVSTQTPVMRAVQAMRAVQEVQVVPAAVLAALMAVEGLVELVELVAAGSEKRLYITGGLALVHDDCDELCEGA